MMEDENAAAEALEVGDFPSVDDDLHGRWDDD
jgi:hypothetical protein